MITLAQQVPVDRLPTPEVVWSAFAPELLLAYAALALLLFTVSGKHRTLATSITGALAFAGGAVLMFGVLNGSTLDPTTGALVAQDPLIVPGAVLAAFGAGTIAVGAGLSVRPALIQTWVAGLASLGALVLTGWQWVDVMGGNTDVIATQVAMQGSVALDGIAFFTRISVLVSVLLVLPMGYAYLHDRRIYRPDFEPLVLFAAIGMIVLGAASDLITLFVAIEMLSLALYVLVGFARRDRRSQEAGLKYFILGAVASAILLYGMALLYLATGSIEIGVIGTSLAVITTPKYVVGLAMAMITVGLGFKVALVPFHLWTPDVYQGAPTNVTGFMAAATKAAGFAALLRLFLIGFGRLEELWVPVLAILAAGTMLYGAVVALVQKDVKRILAYSSVAHAGYAAIGVASGSITGLSATLWYLLTYTVTVIGAHGCIIAVERRRQGEVTLVDLKGLGKTSPALAGIFTLALLSLAGIPPTAGFAGKLAIFRAGMDAGLTWLVIVGVISSVIAAFFYLRLMGMMFLEEPDEDVAAPVLTPGLNAGLAAAAAAIVVLGVLPDAFLTFAERAAALAR